MGDPRATPHRRLRRAHLARRAGVVVGQGRDARLLVDRRMADGPGRDGPSGACRGGADGPGGRHRPHGALLRAGQLLPRRRDSTADGGVALRRAGLAPTDLSRGSLPRRARAHRALVRPLGSAPQGRLEREAARAAGGRDDGTQRRRSGLFRRRRPAAAGRSGLVRGRSLPRRRGLQRAGSVGQLLVRPRRLAESRAVPSRPHQGRCRRARPPVHDRRPDRALRHVSADRSPGRRRAEHGHGRLRLRRDPVRLPGPLPQAPERRADRGLRPRHAAGALLRHGRRCRQRLEDGVGLAAEEPAAHSLPR